jgi:alpha-galactosidase
MRIYEAARAALTAGAAITILTTVNAQNSPVKVYVLSGQSNMVGIGQVNGGGTRWGDEFLAPTVAVYPGPYDPVADYNEMPPIASTPLKAFGGVRPTPYPSGGTRVTRGHLRVKQTGVYELRPGYAGSTYNVMKVAGKEVHRREQGGQSTFTSIKLQGGEAVPFEIIYLTPQANGLGWIARVDIPGTLSTVVKQDKKFQYLIDDAGKWVERDDVYYKGVVTATADKWLSVGCGAGANQIGPELGFGHTMGQHHEEPVLLLKASQGNRSLAWDFLPPGSERFEQDGRIYAGYKDSPASWAKGAEPESIEWYAGKQYDECFEAAKQVLATFDERFPQWDGRGYEIAGFVWWQGHKDQGNAVHATRYEQNLVHLIKTLRREFKAPNAPFVCATIGFGGWEMEGHAKTVAEAQLAVSGERGRYPEFTANVKTVETRDFWRPADRSPREQGFHYNQNAETYMLVGEALGRGMMELISR